MKKTLFILAFSILGGCTHPEPTRYQIFGIEQYRQIKANPKRHIGKLCAFGGRVLYADRTEDQISFQILVQNYVSSTDSYITGEGSLFAIYPSGKTTIAENHQVKVLGYIRGPTVGKNLFGSSVSSLTLDAIAVYDCFTRYPFWLSRYEELFNKWRTGEPLTSTETQEIDRKQKSKSLL
jgi:hypothetical protein